jgi:PAS domain S-box-containing protein
MPYEPQEQELFLKCLLESNLDGILAFDREFRYTTWNRAMERISGVKREHLLGKCRKSSLRHSPVRSQWFL